MRPNWYIAGLNGALHPNNFSKLFTNGNRTLRYLFALFVLCEYLQVFNRRKNSNFLTYHSKTSKRRAENYSKRQFSEQWET